MAQGADPDVFRMCLKPRRSFLGGFVEEGNVETGARCNKNRSVDSVIKSDMAARNQAR
jgi:hypothetical protein